MDKKKNEIILFENQGVKLEVNLKDETVWLNRQQLAELFDRDIKTIGKHINNSLNEELKDDNSVDAKFSTTASDGSFFYSKMCKDKWYLCISRLPEKRICQGSFVAGSGRTQKTKLRLCIYSDSYAQQNCGSHV